MQRIEIGCHVVKLRQPRFLTGKESSAYLDQAYCKTITKKKTLSRKNEKELKQKRQIN